MWPRVDECGWLGPLVADKSGIAAASASSLLLSLPSDGAGGNATSRAWGTPSWLVIVRSRVEGGVDVEPDTRATQRSRSSELEACNSYVRDPDATRTQKLVRVVPDAVTVAPRNAISPFADVETDSGGVL